MATAVYLLCAVASAGCAVLLYWTSWRHRGRVRPLVLWTALCFTGFTISNGLVVRLRLRHGAIDRTVPSPR
jgi:hypothetical protein